MRSASDFTAFRHALRLTRPEIERGAGVPKGVVSHVEAGRTYPYPLFRARVAVFFASRTGMPVEAIHARLFPGYDLPAASLFEGTP